MLRLAAALAVGLGVAALLGYLHLVGKGPWADPAARHLRAMKDRTAAPDSYATFTLADMRDLPRRRPLPEVAAIESRSVVMEGYVRGMLRSVDGDFHLDFVADPPVSGDTAPYVITEVTPQWRRGSTAWSFDGLAAALRPSVRRGAAWEQGPARVRLSGWLLYDYPHEGQRPKPGSHPVVAAWEIHPVTRIELWDDAQAGFVEHPR